MIEAGKLEKIRILNDRYIRDCQELCRRLEGLIKSDKHTTQKARDKRYNLWCCAFDADSSDLAWLYLDNLNRIIRSE